MVQWREGMTLSMGDQVQHTIRPFYCPFMYFMYETCIYLFGKRFLLVSDIGFVLKTVSSPFYFQYIKLRFMRLCVFFVPSLFPSLIIHI